MSFTPQLVALDIDGTLVDEFGRLPDQTKQAVARILSTGVPVVLSTGRSWMATQPIFEALELPPGWAVTSNGAMVLKYPPVEVVFEELFDPSDTLQRVASLAPEALIAVQRGMEMRVNRNFPNGELAEGARTCTLEELASEPVSRIIIRDPNSDEKRFRAMAEQLGLHEVAYFIGWSAWLDIAPLGIDKSHGLQRVVDDFGLTAADVLAVGDGFNDIEMLQWAGRGVAMGNAPEEVRQVADSVTSHFRDDGLVEEIDRWF